MSKVNTFRCDGCGKLREKDSNHWWMLSVRPACIADEQAVSEYVVLQKWSAAIAEKDELAKHYCGEECAQAAVARWMQTGRLEPASATPLQDLTLKTAKTWNG